jgi:hypothetical protein
MFRNQCRQNKWRPPGERRAPSRAVWGNTVGGRMQVGVASGLVGGWLEPGGGLVFGLFLAVALGQGGGDQTGVGADRGLD